MFAERASPTRRDLTEKNSFIIPGDARVVGDSAAVGISLRDITVYPVYVNPYQEKISVKQIVVGAPEEGEVSWEKNLRGDIITGKVCDKNGFPVATYNGKENTLTINAAGGGA
jgi:hypothetical protein